MASRWDLGVLWGVGGPKTFFPKFNQIWCVSDLHEWHMQRHNFLGPGLLGPWGGAKRSNIIKSQLQSPQGLGLWGAGGQKCNFMNMVMWHIKLNGMSSRPGYTENFYPRIKGSVILQSPLSVCPSVRPSRYLLLNHWTKINQIWCVSCSHN